MGIQIVFVVIALCPAVAVTSYENRREGPFPRREWLCRFAVWFFSLNFLVLALQYLRGWGYFAFESLNVRFLVKYMLVASLGAVAGEALRQYVRKRREERAAP